MILRVTACSDVSLAVLKDAMRENVWSDYQVGTDIVNILARPEW